MDDDTSSMQNPQCRILMLSSELSTGDQLVKRIQSLPSRTRHSQTPPSSVESSSSKSELPNGATIPWTISNKYYNADIHFLVHTVKGLAPYQLSGVPAIIYTWQKGRAYRDHILRINKDLCGSEPEVALAVMTAASGDDPDDEEGLGGDNTEAGEVDEDESEIDDFLSTNGFEFIDATLVDGSNTQPERVVPETIPSLPRVLDALSTIMWPSMQGRSGTNANESAYQHDSLLDWAQSGSFDTLAENDLIITRPAESDTRAKITRHRQMAELERWLQEDSEMEQARMKDDPWKSTSESMVESPTDKEHPEHEEIQTKDFEKFEDDFVAFVSAPPPDRNDGHIGGAASIDNPLDASYDNDLLSPAKGSVMYHSLGSQSDLGSVQDESDEDDLLPSQKEIKESADIIFGSEKRNASFDNNFPDDEFDFAAFDLSRVMGALEGMKAEIANIEDDDERRRAAAKVALGLVYGLEKQPVDQ